MVEKTQIISNFIDNELNDVPNILKSKLSFDGKDFNTRSEFDEIKEYLNSFLDGYTSNRLIVLPGLRGVGKSTILFQIYEYLLKEKSVLPNNILYVSCDDLNDLAECSIRELVEIYLNNKFNSNLRTLNEKVFVLIDESQYDKNWALSGKIIYDKSDNVFMVFTGSSALHLEYNADAARRMRKRSITPLSYAEHIRLKYNLNLNKMSDALKELIFTGNIESSVKCESKAINALTNLIEYQSKDWDEYIRFGAFPKLFKDANHRELCEELVEITERVIAIDMPYIQNITSANQSNANRILRYLALQQPGEVSQENLSNYLNTSSANVKKILDILERTHLLFHIEPYGGASNRIKKSWKYYFASSSIRHALSLRIGNPLLNTNNYEGLLLENMVASNLFNLLNKEYRSFNIYYDADKKKNVDFLISQDFNSIIPIEVGRGEKKKSQIRYAMDNYESEYGIVVSNDKPRIEKDGDVIYIPPKTFSFL